MAGSSILRARFPDEMVSLVDQYLNTRNAAPNTAYWTVSDLLVAAVKSFLEHAERSRRPKKRARDDAFTASPAQLEAYKKTGQSFIQEVPADE